MPERAALRISREKSLGLLSGFRAPITENELLQTMRAQRGAVVAPHHLASQAGLRVLQDGGNAIEAMIAAAATIAVVYPHMNALGGDNFWLICAPAIDPVGIDACGAAAAKADIRFYRDRGYEAIPARGSLAALTVAGAVSGWQAALAISENEWGGALPLSRLLEDAAYFARQGFPATGSGGIADQPGGAGGIGSWYLVAGFLTVVLHATRWVGARRR